MAGFNGSGQFSFTYSWTNDAANGVPITASRMDGQFNDAVSGFDLCITRDNQGKPSATMLPDTTNSYDLGGSAATWRSGYFGTSVGIGMTPSNVLDITVSATSGIGSLLNSNTGGTSFSAWQLNNATTTGSLYLFSSGYTTTGVSRQNGLKLEAAGAGGLTLNTSALQPIYFGINSVEAWRISGDKSLISGTTTGGGWTTNARFAVQGTTGSGISTYMTGIGVAQYFRIDNTSAELASFQYNGSEVGSITSNGTTTTYGTSSDSRLKTNIADASDAGAILDGLKVRCWDWKLNGTHEAYGFVAQEEFSVAPFAVREGDANPDTIERQWSRDDSKLVPLLVKEIQSLRARVTALEKP